MINPWKKLSKASLFLEVLDARAPKATTSLTFHKEFKGRSKIIFLMKTSLADKSITRLWIRHYRSLGNMVISVDKGDSRSIVEARAALADWAKHRSRTRQIRASVVGIPNTGKSSLINALVGRKRQLTGDRAGITRGEEWEKLVDGIMLLDQPGVIGDDDVDLDAYWRRVCCGAVPEGDYDPEFIAMQLVSTLNKFIPSWDEHLNLAGDDESEGDFLSRLAVRQGFILPGGKLDKNAAALRLIKIYRKGKFGKISLEKPE